MCVHGLGDVVDDGQFVVAAKIGAAAGEAVLGDDVGGLWVVLS